MSSMHNVRTYFGLFELLVVGSIFCKILQPFCKLFSLFLLLLLCQLFVVDLLNELGIFLVQFVYKFFFSHCFVGGA